MPQQLRWPTLLGVSPPAHRNHEDIPGVNQLSKGPLMSSLYKAATLKKRLKALLMLMWILYACHQLLYNLLSDIGESLSMFLDLPDGRHGKGLDEGNGRVLDVVL